MAPEFPENEAQNETRPLLEPVGDQRENVDRHEKSRLWQQLPAAMVSFAVLGLFASSIGVMVPYLQEQFDLDDVKVSLAFVIPPIGYVFAAQFNDSIHLQFGQRGVAIAGPLCHILCAIIVCLWPKFIIYIAALTVAAVGSALLDGSWCSWAASMKNANSMCGLLHASFATGAGIGPFLATKVTSSNSPWHHWYCYLACAAGVEALVLGWAFWAEDAVAYRGKCNESTESSINTDSSHFKTWKKCLGNSSCWICAAYLLVYVGTETTISDWTVSFMLRSRHTSTSIAAASSSGFWVSMAAGRLVLGPVTDRAGVRNANFAYLCSAMCLALLLSLTTIPWASVLIISCMGFFFGPMFASSIVRLNVKLPASMHIAAVSFVTSIGQIGAASLPYGLGALIKSIGIDIFAPALFIQLAMAATLWAIL